MSRPSKNVTFRSENIPSVSGSNSGIIIPIVNPPKIADRTDKKFEEKTRVGFHLYTLGKIYISSLFYGLYNFLNSLRPFKVN